MKFSIVTPSYNYGHFLRTAADSLLSQSGVDFEYLIHDACSADATPKILEDLALDSRVSVKVERDKGQTNALNKGFARASGDWLAWLNADEGYLPGALSLVESFIRENPDVDVVYGDTLFVDERTNKAWVKREHGFDDGILKYYGCYLASVSTFFRRTAAQRVGPLDETLRCVMDYEYWLRLASHGAKFAYLPRPLGLFRVHATNISNVEAERRLRERREIQLRYCGLGVLPEGLRVSAFEVLKYVSIARRQLAKRRPATIAMSHR